MLSNYIQIIFKLNAIIDQLHDDKNPEVMSKD